MTRSPLLPETPFDRRMNLAFAPITAIYGDGVVVANESRMAHLYAADSMDRPTSNPMVTLLNQSAILPISYVADGGITRYFWKKNTDKAAADWTALGLRTQDGWVAVTANTNATLRSPASDGAARKEIVIVAPAAWVNVRYGGENSEKETQLLVDETLSKVADILWTMEQVKALKNLTSQWTEQESVELKEKGRVHGYSPEYRRDPLSHPALLTDPNNVKFIKR